jgi:hypothetical protein
VPRSASSSHPRLKRWELVGAWTGVWTPPKGVEVPPVPVRKLLLWGLVGVLVIAGLLALLIPPLNKGKREGAARVAHEQAVAVQKEAARLRVDQRVHRAAFTATPVAALQSAITADAKARVGAGMLQGPIVHTKCKAASTDVVKYPNSRVYNCFVAAKDNVRGEGKDLLTIGYPFVATVYYSQHQLAWCKLNPQPGEKTRGHGLARVAMSPVCAGKLAPLL